MKKFITPRTAEGNYQWKKAAKKFGVGISDGEQEYVFASEKAYREVLRALGIGFLPYGENDLRNEFLNQILEKKDLELKTTADFLIKGVKTEKKETGLPESYDTSIVYSGNGLEELKSAAEEMDKRFTLENFEPYYFSVMGLLEVSGKKLVFVEYDPDECTLDSVTGNLEDMVFEISEEDFMKEHGLTEKQLDSVKLNGFYLTYRYSDGFVKTLIPDMRFQSSFYNWLGFSRQRGANRGPSEFRDAYVAELLSKKEENPVCILAFQLNENTSLAVRCFQKYYRAPQTQVLEAYEELHKAYGAEILNFEISMAETNVNFVYPDMDADDLRFGVRFRFSDTGQEGYMLEEIALSKNGGISILGKCSYKHAINYQYEQFISEYIAMGRPFIKKAKNAFRALSAMPIGNEAFLASILKSVNWTGKNNFGGKRGLQALKEAGLVDDDRKYAGASDKKEILLALLSCSIREGEQTGEDAFNSSRYIEQTCGSILTSQISFDSSASLEDLFKEKSKETKAEEAERRKKKREAANARMA